MSADAPQISVITPSYEQARFLEKAIESVRGQAGVRAEHIVVDGGSRDGSVAVLEHLSATAPLRWVSAPDTGQSEAFNKGLRMARAPVIGWLNADDLYAEGALSRVLAFLAAHPEADVVYGDTQVIDEAGRPRRVVRAHGADLEALLLQRFALYHPSIFYRRSALDRVGGADGSLHLVMDFDLVLRLARSCTLARIDAVLAKHRVHGEAKSIRHAGRFMAEYLTVLDRTFADPALAEGIRSLRSAAYQAVYLEGGVRALRGGDRREAADRLRRALAVRRRPDARTLKSILLLVDASTGAGIGRAAVRALGGDA